MYFRYAALSAFTILFLEAAELEYRFLPETSGWRFSSAAPKEIPASHWYIPAPDGRSIRLRSDWNRYRNALYCSVRITEPGEYTVTGQLRSVTGSEQLNAVIDAVNADFRIWTGQNQADTDKTKKAREHMQWMKQLHRNLPAGNMPGKWSDFSFTFRVPDAGKCPNCGHDRRFDQISIGFVLFCNDDRKLTQTMELDLRDLKLAGPGSLTFPSAAPGKPTISRPSPTPAGTPANEFNALSMLQKGKSEFPRLPGADLTPVQRIKLNPAFAIRLIHSWPSYEKQKFQKKLRFPPSTPTFGPFVTSTVHAGKFYGICYHGRYGMLTEFTPETGRWRIIWTNPQPDTAIQSSYGHRDIPLLHTGAMIWSAYGGISAAGGTDLAPLPDFLQKHLSHAVLNGRIYTSSPFATQLQAYKQNGRQPQSLQLNPAPLPDSSIAGLWSYPDSQRLLLKLRRKNSVQFREINPATGENRIKYDYPDDCKIIDTPLGRFADSRSKYSQGLAFDPGAGLPFLLLSGPPQLSPEQAVLPGAESRRIPPDCRPVGLKGAYLLLQTPQHQLLALNLARPEQSLLLHHLPFRRLHAAPDGNSIWLESGDGLYELIPRNGWGVLPAAEAGPTQDEIRLENLNAEQLNPQEALLQTYASDADLFRVRPVQKGKRQVLEFTAEKIPFECRVSLQFNPELTAGKSLRLIFKPDDLARQLPALRVGEGANSGSAPPAADGTVTLRSGSGLVELILEKSDQPVTFTIDTVLVSKGKEFLR